MQLDLVGDAVDNKSPTARTSGARRGSDPTRATPMEAASGAPGATGVALRGYEVPTALDTLPRGQDEGVESAVTGVPLEVEEGPDRPQVEGEDGAPRGAAAGGGPACGGP